MTDQKVAPLPTIKCADVKNVRDKLILHIVSNLSILEIDMDILRDETHMPLWLKYYERLVKIKSLINDFQEFDNKFVNRYFR